LEFIINGILLGLGTSMPIGPVNLEIARRTLQMGFRFGVTTGLGAVCADLTFLSLLSLGSLKLFTQPTALYWINILGSLLIAYFGIKAFRSNIDPISIGTVKRTSVSIIKVFFEGLGMTLLNPLSILYWFAIGLQILELKQTTEHALLFAGLGVMLGTTAWMLIYNSFLHFSKKFVNKKCLNIINKISGLILMGYGLHGFFNVFK